MGQTHLPITQVVVILSLYPMIMNSVKECHKRKNLIFFFWPIKWVLRVLYSLPRGIYLRMPFVHPSVERFHYSGRGTCWVHLAKVGDPSIDKSFVSVVSQLWCQVKCILIFGMFFFLPLTNWNTQLNILQRAIV